VVFKKQKPTFSIFKSKIKKIIVVRTVWNGSNKLLSLRSEVVLRNYFRSEKLWPVLADTRRYPSVWKSDDCKDSDVIKEALSLSTSKSHYHI